MTNESNTTAIYTVPPGKALVLRVCHEGRWSDGNNGRPKFHWPSVGTVVEAPDWRPEASCGYGLHGWLWGIGDVAGAGAEWGFTETGATWLVVEVELSEVIAIGDVSKKVKFPRGLVVFEGSGKDAALFVQTRAPAPGQVILGTSSSGYGGTSTSGDGGTSTSGYGGTSTSGDGGTSTSGDGGTSTSGYGGTSTSGTSGILIIMRWDPVKSKYRRAIAKVGEDGIEADVPYILDAHGKFVKKPQETK